MFLSRKISIRPFRSSRCPDRRACADGVHCETSRWDVGRVIRSGWNGPASIACLAAMVWLGAGAVYGEQLYPLRNGLILRGSHAAIPSLNQNAFTAGAAGEVKSLPILMIDDGLRRTYIYRLGMLAQPPTEIADLGRSIEFNQPVSLGSKTVGAVGQIFGVSEFNEYGRRMISLRGPDGKPVTIVQGITEINDRYAKLEALKVKPYYAWDMRMATRALPTSTLNQIFHRRLDQEDLDQRLEPVRFYIEAKRYGDAHQALRSVIRDFPEEKQLERQLIALTERQAEQLLTEAQFRSSVGQHRLAQDILEKFGTQDVARVTRLKVEDARARLRSTESQASEAANQLRQLVAQLDPIEAAELGTIVDEIGDGLSADTLTRFSDFIRLGNDQRLPIGNRISLGVAGWLLGGGSGEQNLKVAASLVRVRDLVAEYLRCDEVARRQAILESLRDLEGARPEYIAKMLPLLTPPLPFPDDAADQRVPGMMWVGSQQEPPETDIAPGPRYVIQLPPEYNPLREYPCIVALHPLKGTPEQQVEWWSGAYAESTDSRMGQASRNGYIVVAPVWSRDTQARYEFTPREHERVLIAVRDALRRASIDPDRVFIAGHGDGGTAAWDIAISHPDLWAGMISISSEPEKTIPHYKTNSQHVPAYIVLGELDAAPPPLVRIGAILDDYMSPRHDAMVVMYRGRGREFFYEEIHRLFEWMNLSSHRRGEMPRSIDAVTMRESDRFFWWLELDEMKPLVSINPILWDEAERLKAGKVSANVLAGNQLRVSQVPADRFTVWLRPDMGLDLNERVFIRYRSRLQPVDYSGDLEVMLEDARTRGDRKRPFWAKVQFP